MNLLNCIPSLQNYFNTCTVLTVNKKFLSRLIVNVTVVKLLSFKVYFNYYLNEFETKFSSKKCAEGRG